MLGWLYRMIIGHFWCKHQWNIIKQYNTYLYDVGDSPDGVTMVLKCTKCGVLKNHKV